MVDKDNLPDTHTKCTCLIKVVMSEEDEMRKYLRKKSLAWLYNEVYNKNLLKEVEKATIEWFNNSKK
ncbi:DNA-binding IscR family transcriptional regulator [Clostridium beijerinckii]|nr:DNA-binding IscR family transcriptional regulator [Clostridium beijerinckii]